MWHGKNVDGIVTEIHSYGVILNASSLPISTKAFLHISQVSDGYIQNLQTSYTVGQSVTVKVRFLRKDKTAWEVSRKAVLNEGLWAKEFPEFSETVGCVERTGDFGALVKLKDGFVGRISAFQLSFFPKGQQLEVGATLEVRIGKWDFGVQCPLLIPKVKVEETGLIEAVEIRTKTKSNKSKRMLRAKARVNTASYGIVNCDIANFIKIQERFTVGNQVRVSIQLASWSREGFQGEIVLSDSEKVLYGQAPQIGSVIEVPVVSVLDYGAFCLVADNTLGLVHHQLVVQDKKPELGRYVGPGDLLRVRIGSPAENQKGFVLEFIAMVTRFSQEKEQADSLQKLFELKQEKRKHISGGFKRSVSFRTEVLNIFNHTCVLCGKSQRISEDISVAEAAHIVPHSQRGADIIENAICLCPVCHWAFDKGLLGISPDGKVLVSGMIANDSDVATSLLQLNGRQIILPQSFQMPVTALAWHMRNIFLDIG